MTADAEIKFNGEKMIAVSDMANNRRQRVLITGAAGQIGQLVIKQLADHNDFVLTDIRPLPRPSSLPFIHADIADLDAMRQVCRGVDTVLHLATNPHNAQWEDLLPANVVGVYNVFQAAHESGCRRVIFASSIQVLEGYAHGFSAPATPVRPVNLYGATKLVSDKIFVNGNIYAAHSGSRFSCVRYGNVMGSRGSVIPFFKEKAREGVIPITDKRMTRFWITLDQAVDFVLDNLRRMIGGEIFIPKIPSMKITDLAEVVAPGVPTKEIGIRPGEKLHELMIGEDDARHTYEYDNYYAIYPEHPEWGIGNESIPKGKSCPEGFHYSSDNNTEWLSQKDMARVLREQGLL